MTRRNHAGAALLIALAATAGRPATALADHTLTERITDLTAYTLGKNEIRIGLWKVEYGVTDTVSVGTYTFPWAITMPSVTAKWNVWTAPQEKDQLAAGVRAGLYSLDLQRLSGGAVPSRLNIIPVELVGSYRRDAGMSVHAGLLLTKMAISGSSPDEETLRGAAAADNAQAFGQIEWRWGRTTAFITELRLLLKQTLSGSVSAELRPDPFTTATVATRGETDVADFKNASFLSGAFHWSWGGFNLRMGLGLGNLIVPAVNMVLPVKFIFPDFDVYYRF